MILVEIPPADEAVDSGAEYSNSMYKCLLTVLNLVHGWGNTAALPILNLVHVQLYYSNYCMHRDPESQVLNLVVDNLARYAS
jgi:hypothetical protein